MKLTILDNIRMGYIGSSALKSIQNNQFHSLDFIVRECTQNSLDAALSNSQKVKMEFKFSRISCKKIADFFYGIGAIKNKFKDETLCLSIRDSGTEGLTGAYRTNLNKGENFEGNLEKLIYNIGIAQDKRGSGGSQGLGKTVCFRAGCGIVIYYSRNKYNGEYRHILAATLIENEKNSDSILKDIQESKLSQKKYTGIAWWGKGENIVSWYPETETIPFDYKDDEIKSSQCELSRILEALNIAPYKGEETGTTVIIPFLSENILTCLTPRILNSLGQDGISQENLIKDDTIDLLESHIRNTLFKWYFPRISNEYPDIFVGKARLWFPLSKVKPPIFEIMTELFYAACQRIEEGKDCLEKSENCIISKLITIGGGAKETKKIMGAIAYKAYSKEELHLIGPNSEPSPYEYFGISNDVTSDLPPILCYSRKAGMIIRYECNSKILLNLSAMRNEDEVLIVYFQPNSDLFLGLSDAVITFDDYLRETELADHHAWKDIQINGKSCTFISRTMTNIVKAILVNNEKDLSSDIDVEHDIQLQRNMGILLGDSFSKGNLAHTQINNVSNRKNNKKKRLDRNYLIKSSFYIEHNYFNENGDIFVEGNVIVGKNIKKHIFSIIIAVNNTETISKEDWNKESNLDFPAEFDKNQTKILSNFLNITWLSPSSFEINLSKYDCINNYKIQICFKSKDSSLCFKIGFKEENL